MLFTHCLYKPNFSFFNLNFYIHVQDKNYKANQEIVMIWRTFTFMDDVMYVSI